MKNIKTKLLTLGLAFIAYTSAAQAGTSLSISQAIGNGTNVSLSYSDGNVIAYPPVYYTDIYGRQVVYVNPTPAPTPVAKPVLVSHPPVYYPISFFISNIADPRWNAPYARRAPMPMPRPANQHYRGGPRH